MQGVRELTHSLFSPLSAQPFRQQAFCSPQNEGQAPPPLHLLQQSASKRGNSEFDIQLTL